MKSPSILYEKYLSIFFAFNFTKKFPCEKSTFRRIFKKSFQHCVFDYFFFRKKINPEIWSQKYPLGPKSQRPFLIKSLQYSDFENHGATPQLVRNLTPIKKFVVHCLIPMLLLPLTPPLIYLKLKKIKGPKMDSLFFHFTPLSLSQLYQCCYYPRPPLQHI